jgi:hypothetical protein
MKKSEINQILLYAQAVDNRNITDAMIDAWHDVIGELEFDVARAAIIEARKAENIAWIEPRHIMKYARPILDRQTVEAQREERLNELNNATSSPMPKCKHGKGLLYCVPCCAVVKVKR